MPKSSMAVLVVAGVMMSGCGYASKGNVMIGQVKTVYHSTPLVCPEYRAADISLGVVRQGVGSLSTMDVNVVITDDQEAIFRKANETGRLVKIHYDRKRVGGNYFICTPDLFATSVELVP